MSSGVETSLAVPTRKKRKRERFLDFITLRFISLGMTNLNVIAPIDIREKVVPPFAIVQKLLVDVAGHHLIAQSVEADEVIHCALGGILLGGSSFH